MANPSIAVCPSCGAKNRVPVSASGRPRCAKCQADLPWLVSADDADFHQAVAAPGVVLVDLWAPWCGPCRMVAPVLESLAKRYAGKLKVVKVNVDDCPATAARYDARSIPTLLVMRGGAVVDRVVGAQPEPALARTIDAALAAAT
ncbi:MAG: thioredoxin 2 [Actinomycetota bacterium]|nr:thioredoxin 2 [Actinomycetota bacterium]